MKEYLSIPKEVIDIDVYAFDKLDGSNIRAGWSAKKGFYKFGSRKNLIDEKHPLGESISLIKDKYEKDLSRIFKLEGYDRDVTCFFEFLGHNSFAGQHEIESHDVVLFDISPDRSGILPPNQFIKLTKNLHIPSVLYYGAPGKEFLDSVYNNTLPGITFEGVVCKAQNLNKKKTSQPFMFKVKTKAWLDKVKLLRVDWEEILS